MSKDEKMSLEQEGDPRFDGYVPPTLFHNLGLSELGEPGGGGMPPSQILADQSGEDKLYPPHNYSPPSPSGFTDLPSALHILPSLLMKCKKALYSFFVLLQITIMRC